jgi:hypothetical protein
MTISRVRQPYYDGAYRWRELPVIDVTDKHILIPRVSSPWAEIELDGKTIPLNRTLLERDGRVTAQRSDGALTYFSDAGLGWLADAGNGSAKTALQTEEHAQ